MKAAILICLLCLSAHIVRADWFQQNSGTNNYLNDVKFVNSMTGYVGADGGFLLKTTDGGDNWNRIVLGGSNTYISSIFFFDVNNIIFAEYTEFIYKTSDGGVSFDSIQVNIYGMTSVYFPSRDTGYANSKYTGAFKTINGGVNWVNVYPSSNQLQGGIFFINNQTGFVTGGTNNFTVLKTTTGGNTWELQRPDPSWYIFDIQFVNNSTGFCVGGYNNSAVIFKTTDLGNSWVLQYETAGTFNSISFVDENTGYAANQKYAVAKTTNGGLNWTMNINPVLFQGLNKLDFANSETGYAVSVDGRILKTTDGGTVGIQQITNEVPAKFSLYQNYPNPFNPNTNIKFDIPVERISNPFYQLIIYNPLGKEVQTLFNERLQPGSYSVTFDGNNLSSGIYFYKLTTEGYTDTKRMVLIK